MRAPPDPDKPAVEPIRRLAVVLGLGALIAVKLGFLAVYGPTFLPDSGGYADIGNFILAGRLNDPALAGGIFPPTLFRIMGYPALIAFTKLLAGGYWPWLLVALQITLSLAATVAIYRLARAFGLGVWISFATAGLQATALPLVLDQTIITDSLSASLVTLALCGLAIALLRGHRGLAACLGAGLLLTLVFLMREATVFLVAGLVPLAVAAVAIGTAHPWKSALAAVACLMLPVVLVHQLYAQWNQSRVGTRMITSAAQTALVLTLVNASQRGPKIFDGEAALDRVARTVVRNHDFHEVREINKQLFEQHGRSAAQIASDAYAAYFRAWREHPRAMLSVFLSHLKERNTVHLLARPVNSLRELVIWNTGSDYGFAHERSVLEGQWWQVPFVVLHRLEQVASVVLFIALFVFTPWRLVAEGWRSPPALAAAGLWFAYLTFFFVYALVSLEPRYIAGVVSPAIVVAVVNLAWAFERARARRIKA